MQSSGLSQIMCVIPVTPVEVWEPAPQEHSAKPARAKRGQRIPEDSMDIPREVFSMCLLGVVWVFLSLESALRFYRRQSRKDKPQELPLSLSRQELQSSVKGTEQAALLC